MNRLSIGLVSSIYLFIGNHFKETYSGWNTHLKSYAFKTDDDIKIEAESPIIKSQITSAGET